MLCGLLIVTQILSTYCLELFRSTWQRFTHQRSGPADTITGFPTLQMFPSQMTPDNFFVHSKRECQQLENRKFVGPFFGQFIRFLISRYPVLFAYPQLSDFIESNYFYNACKLSHTKANSMVVSANTAIVALLSQQLCILLLITQDATNRVIQPSFYGLLDLPLLRIGSGGGHS